MKKKILIIGQPRSGTSSLLNNICKQDYVRISEPYNYSFGERYEWPLKELESDRVAIKTLVVQIPSKEKSKGCMHFVEFSKLVDRVILLKRNNQQEHFESLLNLHYRLLQNNKINSHKKYVFDGLLFSKIPKGLITKIEELQQNSLEDITEVSEKLNIQPTSYEDLYGEDRMKSFEIINKWDLDLDPFELNEALHPQNRYRQFTDKNLL